MRKAMSELRADADTKFPDNSSGQISAFDLRSWVQDFCDTVTPGYGILNLTTPPVNQNFTTTPSIVTAYDTVALETEPYTANAVTGVVTANDSIVADLQFSASVAFTNNREALFTLYKSGVATPYSSERDGSGTGSPVTVGAGGIIDVVSGDTLDVRVTMDGGTTTAITFTSLILLVRAIPRREPVV